MCSAKFCVAPSVAGSKYCNSYKCGAEGCGRRRTWGYFYRRPPTSGNYGSGCADHTCHARPAPGVRCPNLAAPERSNCRTHICQECNMDAMTAWSGGRWLCGTVKTWIDAAETQCKVDGVKPTWENIMLRWDPRESGNIHLNLLSIEMLAQSKSDFVASEGDALYLEAYETYTASWAMTTAHETWLESVVKRSRTWWGASSSFPYRPDRQKSYWNVGNNSASLVCEKLRRSGGSRMWNLVVPSPGCPILVPVSGPPLISVNGPLLVIVNIPVLVIVNVPLLVIVAFSSPSTATFCL
ncbi:hypothetical protein P885DRAFT_64401 [Corynascus similis CBS 632.67]